MRYQYTSPGFRQRFSPPIFTIPKGVKFLVIVNIIVFIIDIIVNWGCWPVFDGIISNDTQFFNEHEHIKIPLKLGTGYNTETALETLNGITAQYGSPYLDDTKENCLTAIFNHLPLTYPDGRPVVLSEVYMLRQTLKELQENSNSKESSGAAEKESSGATGKRGGRRRRRRIWLSWRWF